MEKLSSDIKKEHLDTFKHFREIQVKKGFDACASEVTVFMNKVWSDVSINESKQAIAGSLAYIEYTERKANKEKITQEEIAKKYNLGSQAMFSQIKTGIENTNTDTAKYIKDHADGKITLKGTSTTAKGKKAGGARTHKTPVEKALAHIEALREIYRNPDLDGMDKRKIAGYAQLYLTPLMTDETAIAKEDVKQFETPDGGFDMEKFMSAPVELEPVV